MSENLPELVESLFSAVERYFRVCQILQTTSRSVDQSLVGGPVQMELMQGFINRKKTAEDTIKVLAKPLAIKIKSRGADATQLLKFANCVDDCQVEGAYKIWSDLRADLQGLALPARGDDPGTQKQAVSKIATALAILSENPGLSIKEIAKKSGCHEKTLSRSKKFKAARLAIKGLGQESHLRGGRNRGSSMAEYSNDD